MSSIFSGLILVFVNFNIDIGSMRIGLIPTFLGYIFILRGLREIKDDSHNFFNVIPAVMFMIAYSAVVYAIDLFGGGATMGVGLYRLFTLPGMLLFAVGLATQALSLYISYRIIMGVKDEELTRGIDLGFAPLFTAWLIMALVVVATQLTTLLRFVPFVIIGVIAAFAVQVCFLVMFFRTKNLYNARV